MDTIKSYWKQLKGWATELKNNLFFRARLKLAVFYFLIIALVVVVFSIVLYASLLANISDNSEDQFRNEYAREFVLSRAKDQVQNDIFVIDSIVLIIATGLGYFLSGQTLKPIKKSLDLQKQFTSDAAHELRTPLAVMKTSTEVAIRNKNSTREQLLQVSESNLEEIDKLSENVESLLNLAREDSNKGSKLSKINLNLLINKIKTRLSVIAEQKNIKIDFKESETVCVEGNSDSLEIAILNLIKNAIQYTPDGGLVEIILENSNKSAMLKIKDNGIGLGKEDLPHIFEPFYKADKSRSQYGGGIGLGLSLAKKIIDKHNAKIDVKSELGKGTEVSVVFGANNKIYE